MSVLTTAAHQLRQQPWKLWLRQSFAVVRMELKKTILGKRLLPAYLLALGPVVLFTLAALFGGRRPNIGNLAIVYAGFYQVFMLRFGIFFGCVAVFSSLFSAETLEKTLHYYLLAPVRREVLVLGKFLFGLWMTSLLFVGSTVATFILMFLPKGTDAVQDFLFNGPGLGHLAWYITVTLLACIGYGATFLLMGILFKNPAYPAVMILGWESLNIFLPAILKKISIIYYLQSLTPVPFPPGPFAVITEPASAWTSIPGMIVVTAVVLFIATLNVRRLQVTYSSD